jgi:hypothetical protein
MRFDSTGVTAHGVARIARLRASLLALALIAMSGLPANAESDLAGTWQGTLDGSSQQHIQVRFSENGYMLFEYTNEERMTQTVEWSGPSRIQYGLPAGGVKTVAVESVHKAAGAVSYVIHTEFEPAGNESPTRQFTYQQHEYRLTNEGMWARITRQTVPSVEDRGGSGGGRVKLLEGILTRVESRPLSAVSP